MGLPGLAGDRLSQPEEDEELRRARLPGALLRHRRDQHHLLPARAIRRRRPGGWRAWRTNPEFKFTAKLWRRFTHERGSALERRRGEGGARGVRRAAGGGAPGRRAAAVPLVVQARRRGRRSGCATSLAAFAAFPLVLEVRHASWNSGDVLAELTERGVGIVNVDQPLYANSIAPAALATSAVAYVRMHGRNYQDWFRARRRPATSATTISTRPTSCARGSSGSGRWPRARRMRELYAVTNNHHLGKAPANGAMIEAMLVARQGARCRRRCSPATGPRWSRSRFPIAPRDDGELFARRSGFALLNISIVSERGRRRDAREANRAIRSDPSDPILDPLNPAQRRAAAARRSAAADHRGRGDREDADAGPPGGGADRARGRPAPDPAADVLAAGGAGDDPAGGAPARARAGRRTPRSPGRGRSTPIANRLLRHHATEIGLDPAFTLLDREDAADLLDRLRHERGPVAHRPALPAQGDLPRHLLERGQHAGAAAGLPRDALPLVPRMGGAAARALRRLRRRQGGAGACSTTTICCSTGST